MEQLLDRCAGIDVGKAEVRVCARVGEDQTVRSFGTMTADLLELSDWLGSFDVTHVAMESTGVYWKPVYAVLEGSCEVMLVNAAHVKHVPGRKTDTIDAAWLAQLLAHGLLRASFVPPPPIRDLRELTRYRKALIGERTRAVNRLHKVLEDTGTKLTSVITDISGVSGKAMLRALVAGETDVDAMAQLARGRMRSKIPELRRALDGRFREHHKFLVSRMLDNLDRLDGDIEAVSGRIGEVVAPFETELSLLVTIPGLGPRSVENIVAEIGTDMSRFPTPGHLASWAGVCPGQHESAGKRKNVPARKGNPWLRATLVECAWSATRSKDTYFAERFRDVRRRRGNQGKAVFAVAHEILVACWHVLSTGTTYDDPGRRAVSERHAHQTRQRAIHQLQALGLEVTVKPAA